APEPPVSANTTASSDASPVTSPITAVRPKTGSRFAPKATASTGCHGEPGSPRCSHTAMPRSARNGSGPGRCHETTIASPADVRAYHVPMTSSPLGTRPSTGTSPAGRSEGYAVGIPGGSDGRADGAPAVVGTSRVPP